MNYALFPVFALIGESMLLVIGYSKYSYKLQIDLYKGFIQRLSVLLSITILVGVLSVSTHLFSIFIYLILVFLLYFYSGLKPFETIIGVNKIDYLLKIVRVIMSIWFICYLVQINYLFRIILGSGILLSYYFVNKIMPEFKLTRNINFSFSLLVFSYLVGLVAILIRWIGAI